MRNMAKREKMTHSVSHAKGAWRSRMGLLLAASVLLIAVLSGCSSSPDKSSMSEASAPMAEAKVSAVAADQKMKVADQSGGQAASTTAQTAASPSQADSKAAIAAVVPDTGVEGADGFNRKLIYRANLVMPVADYNKAQTELRDLVALSGAYIIQFSENANTGERGGNFTIKVAAKGFASLLDGLEKISPSLQRNVQGQDVTEEYVDLDSRLKAKQLVEARLLSFMEKAAKTDDLLAFSNELSKVQEEIEQIKGRMRYLDQNVSYSTIELRMYQQTGNKPLLADPNELTLKERLYKAWNSSLNVLAAVLQGVLVFLAAALPVLVIAAIVALPIWWARKRRKRQLAGLRHELKEQNAAQLHNSEEES